MHGISRIDLILFLVILIKQKRSLYFCKAVTRYFCFIIQICTFAVLYKYISR